MTAQSDIVRLSSALSDRGGLKLWSVLVTILGDMSETGHTAVPGPLLSALVEAMGLQPQAMRVAIHRLKKDGWIKSEKPARVAYYGLSAYGLAETRAASRRIYGAAEVRPLFLGILPPGSIPPDGSVNLARQTVLLGPGQMPPDALVMPLPEQLPDWVRGQLDEAACSTAYAEMLDELGKITDVPADEFDALTLRYLVLHGWRRLVLRSNPLAEAALGSTSAAMRCRTRVAELLAALPCIDPKRLNL